MMTDDMMMGERDFEQELKEANETIASLRLNENLLNEKLEISRTKITKLTTENEKLQKECERWRTLYEIKDGEVTARVRGLNNVCDYYLKEVQFKADTDPNDAVKKVIQEILKHPIDWAEGEKQAGEVM